MSYYIQDIKARVKKESKHPDHKDADAFIFAIFSHGAQGSILGVDGGKVMIDDIRKEFNGINCPALRGKPKIFFIQACQGSEYGYCIALDFKIGATGFQKLKILSFPFTN